jgi:hypothetical protein
VRLGLVLVALVIGLTVGGLVVYFVMRGPSLPRQRVVVGEVTAVNNDGTAFGFATDDDGNIGFGTFQTKGRDAIRVGARLRLVVVEGDGYQVVVSASPVGPSAS